MMKLAPEDLQCSYIEIDKLGLYNHDLDGDYPPEAQELKRQIESSDGILIVTPEYNRSIPGALKNAIDWASRPWGTNSLARKPVGIAGASPGGIGTAVGQQHLKAIMSFCNAPLMNEIEAYITFKEEDFDDDDNCTNESTKGFLQSYMNAYDDFVRRVLTVVPQQR